MLSAGRQPITCTPPDRWTTPLESQAANEESYRSTRRSPAGKGTSSTFTAGGDGQR